MDLSGKYRIAAARQHVWSLITDPTVLRDCIPGCETLEGSPETGFAARVTTKIGPVKATFAGQVTLSNVVVPQALTISGEGKGGVAGFAKGSADVQLVEEGGDTILTYLAKAQVGGKLAQLGSRLIDSTAKKLADEFFDKLAARAVETRHTPGAQPSARTGTSAAALTEPPATDRLSELPTEVDPPRIVAESSARTQWRARVAYIGLAILLVGVVIIAALAA